MSDKCTQVFIQSHWQNIYICLWVDIDAKSKTQSVLNYLVFTLYIHNDKWRPWKYEWNKINKQGEKDAASTWKRLGVCHAASIGIKKSGLSASTIPFIIICTYKNGGICVLHLMCYVLLCTMLLRFSYLFSMEPWAAVKKSFKLVWQCHQLLSGFIANDHLPRVSSQSCLSANDKGINKMTWKTSARLPSDEGCMTSYHINCVPYFEMWSVGLHSMSEKK